MACFAVISPTNLCDNGYVTDQTNYRDSSPFARWVFKTTATHVFIKVYDTIQGVFPDFAEIVVYVNGVYDSTIVVTGVNDQVIEGDLPAGYKTVELVTSLQSKQSTTLRGTFLKSVYFSGGATVQVTASISPMVVYGDSIAVGDGSATPAKEAWTVILRANHPLIVEAWGYRALNTDCTDAAARSTFAAKLATYSPSVVWMAIGVNDYILETMNAANFETAYADLLDKLHTALPSVTIYAQTMLPKTADGANALGSTLANYRTAISNAQSTRSEYCVLVDGLTLLSAENLAADGTHPTTTGHAEIAAAIEAIL